LLVERTGTIDRAPARLIAFARTNLQSFTIPLTLQSRTHALSFASLVVGRRAAVPHVSRSSRTCTTSIDSATRPRTVCRTPLTASGRKRTMKRSIENEQWERAFVTPPYGLSLILSLLLAAAASFCATFVMADFTSSPTRFIKHDKQLLLLLFSFTTSYVVLRLRTGTRIRNALLIVMPVLSAFTWLAISTVLWDPDRIIYTGLFIVLIVGTGIPIGLRVVFFTARCRILEAAWNAMWKLAPQPRSGGVGQRHRQITEHFAATRTPKRHAQRGE